MASINLCETLSLQSNKTASSSSTTLNQNKLERFRLKNYF